MTQEQQNDNCPKCGAEPRFIESRVEQMPEPGNNVKLLIKRSCTLCFHGWWT